MDNMDRMSRAIEDMQENIRLMLELNKEAKEDRAEIKDVVEELKRSVRVIEQKVNMLTADNITYLESEVV